MKLNQLYSDIDTEVINILYNKLKKYKLKKKINVNLNNYKIELNKVNITIPLNTRYQFLKNKFDLSKYNEKSFSIYWDKNFDDLNKWFNYLYKYNFESDKLNRLIYQKLILSKFISQDVINDIISRTKFYATIIGNNREIIIFGKTKEEIKIYIMKTVTLLNYFNLFHYNNTKINIYSFLSDRKKKFPKDSFYTPYHVNTAYSIAKTEIVMFRKEEYEKVLIHELIHFYKLDIYDRQSQLINKFPKFNFRFNPNEAYTDFFAIILHILYVNHITNISLKKLIKIELGFINHQAKKILNKANANNINTLLKIFNQSTSVFSYFILKSAMFNNKDLLNTLNLHQFNINYMKIPDTFISKKWNRLLKNQKNLLSSNNQKMSYISKYVR
jgi:hypothetical protein